MSDMRNALKCFCSPNELFAMKKNLGQDAKLKHVINSLSLEHAEENEIICHQISAARKSLKEIHLCTGHSSEGVPSSAHRDRSLSGHFQTFLTESNNSENGVVITNFDDPMFVDDSNIIVPRSAEPLMRDWIQRSMTTVTHADVENFKHQRLGFKRRVKSDGTIQMSSVSVDSIPKVCTKRGKSHLTTFQSVSLPNVNIGLSHKIKTDTDIKTTDINENKNSEISSEEKALMTRRRYNPWNIQYANGNVYNGLSLPNIQDCSRPLCRPNCTTCLNRKLRTPCLLIPGLTCPYDHVHDLNTISDDELNDIEDKKDKKRKQHARKKKQENTSFRNDKIDKTSERKKSEASQDLLPEWPVKQEPKQLNKQRLNELAMPKGGYKKELRYSKASIKREIERMKKQDPLEEYTEAEKENLRQIQSRIKLFLAMTNFRCETVRPNKMVDIPHRDDIMKVDISHIGVTASRKLITLPLVNKKRVYFNF